MGKLSANYELLKSSGPSESSLFRTALLCYIEHMEIEHDATQKDYGVDVLGWHETNHPTCKTLRPFQDF